MKDAPVYLCVATIAGGIAVGWLAAQLAPGAPIYQQTGAQQIGISLVLLVILVTAIVQRVRGRHR